MSIATNPDTRDLDADLAVCEAATPGPYRLTPCSCGKCDLVFISLSRSGGLLLPGDARFIAEARTGWPHAINRAQEAERENVRLRNELDALQLEVNQQHRSACYD
ncbi:hypothetical protein [Cohnella abietis]|uniref:Uncharacterized protein n=1 Tax=Cohnella abietis TaxID=2507935 RepID=A0A3T1D2L1_9BACL|nr:hypothetical protein [Cohnella abietis]BBI32342.1 hypothetical protein KCTCHS21_17410 [Cohnella abietis]